MGGAVVGPARRAPDRARARRRNARRGHLARHDRARAGRHGAARRDRRRGARSADAGARRDRRGRCGPRSARRSATICCVTQFRRVDALPPYAFAEVERLKLELRRAGEDVIDLGFGNPDVAAAGDRRREAARSRAAAAQPPLLLEPRPAEAARARCASCTRSGSASSSIPETEATMSLGAKEGLVHLLWVLLGPGDVALVPSPSYPIHLFAPGFAGAAVQRVPVGPDVDFVAGVEEAWELSQPRPRVLLCSFPHNPTTAIADREQMQELVDFAREKEMVLVHDFAYADLAFDGYRPPSIFEAEGAREVAVELYSLTKGFSLAGWRIAFVLGRADVVGALARLKSYLDYGTFQPLQICGDGRAARGARASCGGRADLPGSPRRTVQRPAAHRVGRAAAARDDVRLGAHPDRRAVAGLRPPAAARGARRRQPGQRVRRRRRGLCPLRARRERAANRPGRARAARAKSAASADARNNVRPRALAPIRCCKYRGCQVGREDAARRRRWCLQELVLLGAFLGSAVFDRKRESE